MVMQMTCTPYPLLYLGTYCRFGDIAEVVGITGHPYTPSKGESLVHSLFKFKNGKTASLYCNYMDIPMTPLPFFQIFGTKVG